MYVPPPYSLGGADDIVDERAGPESIQDVWESPGKEPPNKDAEGELIPSQTTISS